MSFSRLSTGTVTESEAGCKAISFFAGGSAMVAVKESHSGEMGYIYATSVLLYDDVTGVERERVVLLCL